MSAGTSAEATQVDAALVREVNERTGANLRVVGRAEHGTLGGAVFVEWPDGRDGVVSRFLGSLGEARRTADVLDHARRLGLPVPRQELVVAVDDDVVMVQERLTGSAPQRVSPEFVDSLVDLNDTFADVLADRRDVPLLPLCLTTSGNSYPRHEVLEAHSARSRQILDVIRKIGVDGPNQMTGTDLVHIDLTPPNILMNEDGAITGVVDWNLGAYRGDRHLALVKTRFELEWGLHSLDPDPALAEAAAHLDSILAERVAPEMLRSYWAHRMLYQLHFALQFATPDVANWHLEVAETRLAYER